jgi:hypothetical protein
MSDPDSPALHRDAVLALEEADLALSKAELAIGEPHRLDDVDREWVERVLARDAAGARLESLTEGAGHDGMTNRRKWTLRWNAAGEAAGLPSAFFVKATPPAGFHRETLALLHMGQTEVAFYRQVQPELPHVAPTSYYGAAYPGGRYILLLEDLDVRGLRPHWMADHCSAEHAKAVATAMADYHALFWESSRFEGDLSWVRPRSRRYGWNWHADGMRRARVAFLDTEFAQGMPDAVRTLLHRYNDVFLDLHRYWDTRPLTLAHGDSHLGNTFSAPDGTAGFFDWQLVFRGSGFRDLAYFVYSALTIDDRQKHEAEVFDHYVEALKARGVVVNRRQAWNDYCLLILERWDSLLKSTTHGLFGHDPSAYRRQAESITAGLLEHDVAGLVESALSTSP